MRAISFILAGWITKFRFWLKNKNKDSIIKKLQPIHALMIIAAGIVAALVTTLILNGLNIIFADTLFMQDYVSVASGYNINEYNIWYALLIMVIIDPLIEELICRVIIGGIIDVIFGIRLFTIISSSMIFSILHEGIVQRVYALIFGVILSILYYYGPSGGGVAPHYRFPAAKVWSFCESTKYFSFPRFGCADGIMHINRLKHKG